MKWTSAAHGRNSGWNERIKGPVERVLRLRTPDVDYNPAMQDELDDLTLPRPDEHRPEDELANLLTHGGGFLLTLPAAALLMGVVVPGHPPRTVAACGVYCATLVGLYGASALSHLFHDLAWRRFFRTLDQACIFLLIAGSFTPIAMTWLRDGWWPLLLEAMWVLAFGGVGLVLWMRNLTPIARISYGILGWLPALSLKRLFEAAPPETLAWFVAGGLFYSVGTLFLKFDRRVRYFHALWHAFVIAGSACHYLAILTSVESGR